MESFWDRSAGSMKGRTFLTLDDTGLKFCSVEGTVFYLARAITVRSVLFVFKLLLGPPPTEDLSFSPNGCKFFLENAGPLVLKEGRLP